MSSVAAVCARSAGVREPIGRMAVPSATRSVRAPIQASRLTPSEPQASETQTESNPTASARSASATGSGEPFVR